MQHCILFLGEVATRILSSQLTDPDAAEHQMRPEIRRRASNDAVVIVRETLRFLQSLFAARRAATPVGMLESVWPIKRGDDSLRLHGHFVDRAIAEINHFPRVAQCETGIASVGFVPSIGRRSGIAPSKC